MFKIRPLPNGWYETYELDKDGKEITGRLWNMFHTKELAEIEVNRLNDLEKNPLQPVQKKSDNDGDE